MAEFTNMYLNRLGHKHINFVWAGGYIGSWMQSGTPDWVKGYVPAAAAGLERDSEDGLLVQCGGDAMMGTGGAYPGGGVMGLEQFVSYDGNDKDSTRAAGIKHMEDAVKDAARHRLPARQGSPLHGDAARPTSSASTSGRRPSSPSPYVFQRKIKEHFDPNDVGDRMYNYIPEEWEPAKKG